MIIVCRACVRLAFLIVALLAVYPGRGETEPLTLEQALALAEEQHPRLRAAVAQVVAAQAGIVTARTYPNPQVGMLGGAQTFRVRGNVSGPVYSVSLAQPLDFGPVRSSRIELAEQERERSSHALALARLEVFAGVRRAFYQALRQREEIDLMAETLRLVEELRRRIQVRVNVGETGKLELIRADAEVAVTQTAANRAQLEYVRTISQLRAAMGLMDDTALEIAGTLDPPVQLPSLAALRHEVLERHPALALAHSEVRRAEARLRYESALRLPQPTLLIQMDRPPDTPNYLMGVELPLPLWNRRQGPIAEARAALQQAREQVRQREIEILTALEGAYRRYQIASQQLRAFEEGLLREAEEAVRAAETAYQLGERGILEVLDAQRVLRTVRLNLLNAQFDRQAARIDLDELRALELR